MLKPGIINVGGFDKNTVPGLVAWYEADLGVTLNGSLVTQWDDQSNAARNVAQSNNSYRPTLVTNVINGHSVVRFDGVNDHHLEGSSFGVSSYSPYTVYSVVYLNSETATSRAVWEDTDLKNGTFYNVSAANKWDIVNNNNIYNTIPVTLGSWQIIKQIADGASSGFAINGGSDTTTTNATGTIAGLTLGGRTNGLYIMNGDMAAFLLFDHAATAGEQATVLSYLNSRFAVY